MAEVVTSVFVELHLLGHNLAANSTRSYRQP